MVNEVALSVEYVHGLVSLGAHDPPEPTSREATTPARSHEPHGTYAPFVTIVAGTTAGGCGGVTMGGSGAGGAGG